MKKRKETKGETEAVGSAGVGIFSLADRTVH